MDQPPPAPSIRHANSRTSSVSSSPSASSIAAATSVTQSITSILNNPQHASSSWVLPFLPSGPSDPLPPPPSVPPCSVSRSDFAPYVSAVAEPYARFFDVRSHSTREGLVLGAAAAQGEALVACLREVPSLFFEEGFALEEGATFRAACPLGDDGLQERLTQWLDIVETHLVREIAQRSDSFYEAQGKLGGLDVEIVAAVGRIRDLRVAVRDLTAEVVGPARQVQELNATRVNLVALKEKLTVMGSVSHALSDLKLLVAAADCAGALDIMDALQHLLDTDELTGLHCFRHIRDQLTSSLDTVNSILSAEFVREAIPGRDVDVLIISNVKRRAAGLPNGTEHNTKADNGENFVLRDNLLPHIICLLRTAKLSSVLRIYRETIITNVKGSIKAAVADLLPVLMNRQRDFDGGRTEGSVDSDAGSQSLASKLRNLSPESFVHLLSAIFEIVQIHLLQAAEVKRIVEWIMANLDGGFGNDITAGEWESAASPSEEPVPDGENGVISTSFSIPRSSSKSPFFRGKGHDMPSPNSTKSFRADVLRENTEAVCSACEVAHQRWAKLLIVRALIHPKLRLREFLGIYNITQEFVVATEKVAGRRGYSIRGTLQTQTKSFVDYQHEARMTKIRAVLDQETWVAVDVPQEFQEIVILLSAIDSAANSAGLVGLDSNEQMVSAEASSGLAHQNSAEVAENSVDHDDGTSTTASGNKVEGSLNHGNAGTVKDNARTSSQVIIHGGVGYHMVNCGLMLLKMLSEYLDISKYLPTLATEVVQRVVEILKLFNTRTCQLVLGAGAMQVSGLKSITSKHLALASQIVSFIYAIIPDIRRALFLQIPDARQQLLMSEFDRVAQDYKVHRDEIHTKLVQIMRERLLANLRKLSQIVPGWNAPEDGDPQPSLFAKAVTKEVNYLHRILSQTLLEVDVHTIFRQVVQIFHSLITEEFRKLDVNTPQVSNRLCRDVQHILKCIRGLPSENFSTESVPNYGLLDEFLHEKFGLKVEFDQQ